ncbi:hypothetical protein DRP04_12005, partial [Archaeoglobales archaeon]
MAEHYFYCFSCNELSEHWIERGEESIVCNLYIDSHGYVYRDDYDYLDYDVIERECPYCGSTGAYAVVTIHDDGRLTADTELSDDDIFAIMDQLDLNAVTYNGRTFHRTEEEERETEENPELKKKRIAINTKGWVSLQ